MNFRDTICLARTSIAFIILTIGTFQQAKHKKKIKSSKKSSKTGTILCTFSNFDGNNKNNKNELNQIQISENINYRAVDIRRSTYYNDKP